MMLRIYSLLEEMAGSLATWRRIGFDPQHEADLATPGKKSAITVPLGLDFSTWRWMERRRLDRIADALDLI